MGHSIGTNAGAAQPSEAVELSFSLVRHCKSESMNPHRFGHFLALSFDRQHPSRRLR
jgi:hypothetical protein